MIIWSIMALIITSCFSGGILNILIVPEFKNINSFEEMVDSGLKIYVYNGSMLFAKFNNKRVMNMKLDDKLSKIETRLDSMTSDEFRMKV